MYTFLIVDDEPIVRMNIVYLLNQNKNTPFHILEASTGRAALDILEMQTVDVMLIDIRMPDINGLNLMEWVNKMKWPGKYAVISGYSTFEYVHKALESGAAHYILKPIDEQKFHYAIDSMIEIIQKEEQIARIEHQLPIQQRQNHFLHMEGSLNRQLAEYSVNNPVLNEMDQNNIFEMGVMLCNADGTELPRAELQSEVVGLMQSIIENDGDLGIVENYINDHELILLYSPEDGVFDGNVMLRISQDIRHALENAGISHLVSYTTAMIYGDDSQLLRAHTRCHEQLKLRFSEGRDFFKESPLSEMICIDENRNGCKKESLCMDYSLKENFTIDFLREWLYHIFAPEILAGQSIDNIRSIFLEILREIDEKSKISDIDREAKMRRTRYAIDFFDTTEDIVTFFIEMIRNNTSENNGNTFRQSREEILAYIHTNYSKTLTMTDVAERFMFHPNYFSGAFHEMMDTSFSDYVTALRLSDAMILLRESSLSVRTIAETIGYKSQSYFQRVFKKEKGITPMEYRNRQ